MKYRIRLLKTCTLVVLLSACESMYGKNLNKKNTPSYLTNFYSQQLDSILYDLKNKADSLYQRKRYNLALEIALKVLDESDKKEDLKLIAETNFLLGNIWYDTRS